MTDNPMTWAGLAALPEPTRDRLHGYMRLLEKWNPSINLVARASLPDAWTRHFADSAQLFSYRPRLVRRWLDLGSGGGFPGLVVAILALDEAPELKVELVESDQRKCVFLQAAAQSLGLTVTISRCRIEALTARSAHVISARALAQLKTLCHYAVPNLAPGGVCLFLKGAGVESELAEARASFRFSQEIFPSAVDGTGVVLRMADLAHV